MTRTPSSARRPGWGMTLSDQLHHHAQIRPSETALVFGDVRRTFAEVDDRASRLSGVLRAKGVRQGDRVVVLSFNALEVIETYAAVARAGAVSVPANFRLTADELAYVLTDSEPSAIVVHAPFGPVLTKARELAGHEGPCLVFGGVLEGADEFEAALAAAPADFEAVPVDDDAAAVIMYTSGTTGRPKGAVLTHRNMYMHAFSDNVHQQLPAENRVALAATPLFHIAALAGLMSTVLVGGRTIVLPNVGFDPAAILDLLEKERVSNCFLVPTQWQAVCDVPGIAQRDLSALRRVGWGAAPATTTFLERLISTFPGAEVSTAYGQTECSGLLTVLDGRDSLRKIGSVGTPLLNVEIRIVDSEMKDVPRGEIGELVYRSPMTMKEYWNKPEATEEAYAGGWFHSGDLVRQDDEGYFYIVDRKKDMIISGGENIYCAEVEDVLAAHPKVGEVALIGMPDDTWGESPLAVVVPREPADPPTLAELVAWCTDRLARYKHPRHIAIVDEFPRNPSGKVLKTQLRADREAGKLSLVPG